MDNDNTRSGDKTLCVMRHYYDEMECDLWNLATWFESLASALSDSKPLLAAEIQKKAVHIVDLMLDYWPNLRPEKPPGVGVGPQ